MTPDKQKEPLPMSKTEIFFKRPSSYEQWKTALQCLKVLYLKGQWKQCSIRCQKLLEDADPRVSSVVYCLGNYAYGRSRAPYI